MHAAEPQGLRHCASCATCRGGANRHRRRATFLNYRRLGVISLAEARASPRSRREAHTMASSIGQGLHKARSLSPSTRGPRGSTASHNPAPVFRPRQPAPGHGNTELSCIEQGGAIQHPPSDNRDQKAIGTKHHAASKSVLADPPNHLGTRDQTNRTMPPLQAR